jgi:hypothetical protein
MTNQIPKSRVSFFPVPLSDELLDSVVFRYHKLSGARNPAATVETLFGKRVAVPPKLLTNCLDTLWANVATKQFPSTDDLIESLTLVPAFGAILDERQMQSAWSSSYRSLTLGMGTLYRSPIRVIASALQSCPMCVNEEFERLGVAYWHRSHQLDGVKVCHLHGCDLHSSCRHCHQPIRPANSMQLPQLVCQSCKKTQLAVFSHPEPVRRLAVLATQALLGTVSHCDRQMLARKVRQLLGSDTAQACDQMRERYGSEYINSRSGEYSSSFNGDWLKHGFRRRHTVRGWESDFMNLPSLGHMLMLVDFLFGSWDSLLDTSGRQTHVA